MAINTRLYIMKSEIQKEYLKKLVTQPCFEVEGKRIEFFSWKELILRLTLITLIFCVIPCIFRRKITQQIIDIVNASHYNLFNDRLWRIGKSMKNLVTINTRETNIS